MPQKTRPGVAQTKKTIISRPGVVKIFFFIVTILLVVARKEGPQISLPQAARTTIYNSCNRQNQKKRSVGRIWFLTTTAPQDGLTPMN